LAKDNRTYIPAKKNNENFPKEIRIKLKLVFYEKVIKNSKKRFHAKKNVPEQPAQGTG